MMTQFSFCPKYDLLKLITLKDKLAAGLERSVNNSVFVCFMTRSQRDAFMLAVFQVAKSMGEENTCSSPPSVPSLSHFVLWSAAI